MMDTAAVHTNTRSNVGGRVRGEIRPIINEQAQKQGWQQNDLERAGPKAEWQLQPQLRTRNGVLPKK